MYLYDCFIDWFVNFIFLFFLYSENTVVLPMVRSTDASMRAVCGTSTTLQAEVIWTLYTVSHHNSYSANSAVSQLFPIMFPDSMIAKSFSCGKDKTGYLVRFGLAPYFKQQLVSSVSAAGEFVVMFDESLNMTTKSKQMDLHLRFWENGEIQSHYFGSQFMGHSRSEDILDAVKQATRDLNLRNLVSVSMDGPNVNFKFLNLLQEEQANEFGGRQLLMVGSCGLHTLHNAFKAGMKVWEMGKVLRALHMLFHNVPARREDFCDITKSDLFPLPFCGHRWVENLAVAERAIEIWPSVCQYVDAVSEKKIPNPGTASYDLIQKASKNLLITAKLHFIVTMARLVQPFLTKYQTDEPLMPFLHHDLSLLVRVRFFFLLAIHPLV